MRVVVMGAGGMLGAMVTSVAAAADLDVTATERTLQTAAAVSSRLPRLALNAEQATEAELRSLLDGASWAINCIGIIKPHIKDDNPAQVERAIRVNGLFPHTLARAAEQAGCRVLQIATDCVYSGATGNYLESAPHDALDVYGKTKSLGEVASPALHHLRCSIIGPELRTRLSLLEWFRSQPQGATLRGFVNHRWNGITTLHFARLCVGVIRENLSLPRLQHVVPSGDLTKKDLLDAFAKEFGRNDLAIDRAEAAEVIDRRLSTANESANRELWRAAGYAVPPTVPAMVAELAAIPSVEAPI